MRYRTSHDEFNCSELPRLPKPLLMQRPLTSRPTATLYGRPDCWSRTRDAWGRDWSIDEYRCLGCGYDLKGSPAPDDVFRCPKCGQEMHRYEAIIPHKQSTSWWLWLRLPMLICLGIWLLWLFTGLATVLIVPVALFVAFALYSTFQPLGK